MKLWLAIVIVTSPVAESYGASVTLWEVVPTEVIFIDCSAYGSEPLLG